LNKQITILHSYEGFQSKMQILPKQGPKDWLNTLWAIILICIKNVACTRLFSNCDRQFSCK